MLYLVIALVALDVIVFSTFLGVIVRRKRSEPPIPEHGDVFVAPRPAGLRGRDRRMLSIEILDPNEVAATRGRALGIFGSLAPGLVRRVVYDQTRKIVQSELDKHGVRADVRLHTLRPATAAEGRAADVIEAVVVDAPPPRDL